MKEDDIKLDELNRKFDEIKMQGDWIELLDFLDLHGYFLTRMGWDIYALKNTVKRIQELVNEL